MYTLFDIIILDVFVMFVWVFINVSFPLFPYIHLKLVLMFCTFCCIEGCCGRFQGEAKQKGSMFHINMSPVSWYE